MPVLIILAAALLVWLTTRGSQASVPQQGGMADYQSNLDNLTEAWARNEGFPRPGTIPNRYNNPGDLKSMTSGNWNGQVGTSSGGFAIFQDIGDGWDALSKYITGLAARHPDWDFYDLSAHALGSPGAYPAPVDNDQGDSNAYAEQLADYVGVDPATQVSTFLGMGS